MIALDFPNAIDCIDRFYGREHELGLIITTIMEGRNIQVVVIGERRVGKTSIQNVALQQLKDAGTQQFIPLAIEPRVISTVDQFVEAILSRLSTWAGKELLETGLLGTDRKIHYDYPAQFESAFERLLLGKPEQCFLLCVDEFDELIRVTSEVGEQEQIRLMGLIHHLVENIRLPLSLFFSMTRLPETAANEAALPLLAKSQVVELKPFDLDDMCRMVRGLVNGQAILAEDEMNWLYRMSGGHPYLTKLILANLFEHYPLKADGIVINHSMMEAAATSAVDDPRGNYALENIYRVHMNADEKRVLLYLAERGEPVDASELRTASFSTLTAAKNLEKRHYLVNHCSEYTLRAHFLGEWLRNWAEFDEEIERLGVNRMVSSFLDNEMTELADDDRHN